MKNLNSIISQLLSCGYLDVDFLDNLIWAYDIDLDIEELRSIYDEIDNINILIYSTYEQIKDMFFEENKEAIEALWFDIGAAEEWEDYTIFTNYLDSHLWFMDEKLDEMYQNWRRH